jgi:hypothetical protein
MTNLSTNKTKLQIVFLMVQFLGLCTTDVTAMEEGGVKDFVTTVLRPFC